MNTQTTPSSPFPALHTLGAIAAAGALLVGAALLPTEVSAQPRHLDQSGLQGPRVAVSRPVPRAAGPYRGGHGHGYRHGGHGWGWGGLALGLGIGALVFSRPWEPVVIEPRPAYVYPVYPDPPQTAPAPVPPAPQAYSARPPDPVIYPSKGQSPEQTEADRQACNRWATTQQSAMADASVFHRATLACLEGRGYTVR